MFLDDKDRERFYKILAFILALLIIQGVNDLIKGCIVMDKLDKIEEQLKEQGDEL